MNISATLLFFILFYELNYTEQKEKANEKSNYLRHRRAHGPKLLDHEKAWDHGNRGELRGRVADTPVFFQPLGFLILVLIATGPVMALILCTFLAQMGKRYVDYRLRLYQEKQSETKKLRMAYFRAIREELSPDTIPMDMGVIMMALSERTREKQKQMPFYHDVKIPDNIAVTIDTSNYIPALRPYKPNKFERNASLMPAVSGDVSKRPSNNPPEYSAKARHSGESTSLRSGNSHLSDRKEFRFRVPPKKRDIQEKHWVFNPNDQDVEAPNDGPQTYDDFSLASFPSIEALPQKEQQIMNYRKSIMIRLPSFASPPEPVEFEEKPIKVVPKPSSRWEVGGALLPEAERGQHPVSKYDLLNTAKYASVDGGNSGSNHRAAAVLAPSVGSDNAGNVTKNSFSSPPYDTAVFTEPGTVPRVIRTRLGKLRAMETGTSKDSKHGREDPSSLSLAEFDHLLANKREEKIARRNQRESFSRPPMYLAPSTPTVEE